VAVKSWRSAWQPTSTIVQGIEIRHGNFLRSPPYSSRRACVSEGTRDGFFWRCESKALAETMRLDADSLVIFAETIGSPKQSPDSRSAVARLNSNDCRQQVAVVAAALEVSAAAESDRAARPSTICRRPSIQKGPVDCGRVTASSIAWPTLMVGPKFNQ